jgi:hypothetical protein
LGVRMVTDSRSFDVLPPSAGELGVAVVRVSKTHRQMKK